MRRVLASATLTVLLLGVSAGRLYAQPQITANGVSAPNPTYVAPGGTVSIAVTNGPGNTLDWLALYAAGAANTAYLDWFYLNGSKTAPSTGLTSATVSFTMPQTLGAYEVRFLLNNGFTVAATTGAINVAPPVTISSLTPSSGHIGDVVTVTGTNFGQSQGSSTLAFNGTASSPFIWSNSSIRARVPAGAITGSVVATVGGQPSNSLTFTVLAPTTGTLSGAITRASGGAAVSGATINAISGGVTASSGTSAADGSYSIAGLATGTYDVRVTASGLFTEVRTATISSGASTTLNVALLQPGSISGTVTQSNGTTAIAGASVKLFVGSSQKGVTSTSSTGAYSITGLRPGAYTVEAASVGYQTTDQGATISENANTTANVSLAQAVTGTVSYVYDELGRLVSVVDQYGNAANYKYDPSATCCRSFALERRACRSVSSHPAPRPSAPV